MAKTSKDILLKDLNDDRAFEEDLLRKLTDFYFALDWKTIIDPKFHKSVEKKLATLKNETEKHARYISEMIIYIEGSGKNEF